MRSARNGAPTGRGRWVGPQRLPQPERFGWIVAPASNVVQPGPVHGGLTTDPAVTLERLFATMVRVPRPD